MTADSKGRDGSLDVIADSDVVVVGAGLAGMSAAIEASRLGSAVTLVTDGALGRSNSIMAQGGIQLPREEPADIESMVQDMLLVGGADADPDRVRRFVEELPDLTRHLEAMGLEFDRDDRGDLMRRSAGGLSTPRVATVGDQIGRPLMKLLRARVSRACEVITGVSVRSVEVGEGIYLRSASGIIRGRAAVIATGGVSYQEAVDTGELTSNPPNENAVLRASLSTLGLQETGSRQFQWHPFGILASRKGVTVSCVPESVAALGPRLVTERGVEVSSLPAPRSEVVAAIRVAMADGAKVHLTLGDLSDHDLERFPQVQRFIREFGPQSALTPVLHYELSGYLAGPDQESGLPGLYLAGEIVGGLHGRERLMGAGVGDSLIHGRRAGASAARFLKEG